jgi:hypothetical protein
MSQVSTSDVVNLFKRVYGDLRDLQPEDYPLAKDMAFSQKERVGDSYVEAMVLTAETGWTMGGSGMDAFDLNPAIAGTVKQTSVNAYTSILASVVPWGVLARSAGGGDRAFFDGTKHIVRNNLKSHGKLLEVLRLYGQAGALLGYVSYATATYRGVSFTNGAGTLTVNGSSVTFTAGVNTTTKWILLAPGSFAAGIWVGSEGAVVQQVNSSGTVVAQGKLVAVDSDMGAIQVDFTPVAASSTTSHRLCFQGQAETKDAIGIASILSNTGTLFGIATTSYSLWKGNYVNVNAAKFTFDKLQTGIAQAVNRGGLDGDIDVYVNPRTWGTLITTEAAKRVYDKSYSTSQAENGQESITFYHQAGKANIKAHRMVKEGDAFGLHLPDWTRSGSSEISFTVPGINKEIIFPLENQAAMAFRSFSDQYVFNHAPARSIYWYGINDESAS